LRKGIVAGATFPDCDLPDQTGKHKKLSQLQDGDPMIVVCSRRGLCPKDRRRHDGLVELFREIEVGAA
jgi:peroxiredoxin